MDFDLVFFDQCIVYCVEDGFDCEFGIVVGELVKMVSQGFNEVVVGYVWGKIWLFCWVVLGGCLCICLGLVGLVVVVVEFGVQQGVQVGGVGVFVRRLLVQGSYGFLLVSGIFGFDG